MPTYLIATKMFDGFGDYTHFHDIIKTLQANPKYKDVTFTLFLMDEGSNLTSRRYQLIEEKLRSLELPYYHWASDEWRKADVDQSVVNALTSADQLVFISGGDIDDFPVKYKTYISKSLPKKHIWEHDISIPETPFCYSRGLGLGKDQYGFKINSDDSEGTLSTWEILTEHDDIFASKLLSCTGSATFDAFNTKHELIPAYFNHCEAFFCIMIPKLGMNTLYPEEGKDFVIYYSGKNLIQFIEHECISIQDYPDVSALIGQRSDTKTTLSNILKITQFKSLEIIQPDPLPTLVIPGNPDGTKSLKIVTGFFVTDASYHAICKQSKMAGVSGDNTLEQCVSLNILPLYSLTARKTSIETLNLMIQDELIQRAGFPISDEAKRSFHVLLSPHAFIGDYHTLNFAAMIEAWPRVTAYLRKYHNFYDELDKIIQDPEARVSFSEEKLEQKKIESIFHIKCWMLSSIERKFISGQLHALFLTNLRHSIVCIADLCYQKLLSTEQAYDLMSVMCTLNNDLSKYRDVIAKVSVYQAIACDKLCPYLMLTAGYAAACPPNNQLDNEWIKQATKKLKEIDGLPMENNGPSCTMM